MEMGMWVAGIFSDRLWMSVSMEGDSGKGEVSDQDPPDQLIYPKTYGPRSFRSTSFHT